MEVLTHEDRARLNGNVEKIVRTHGDSREALLAQVRDLLADSHAERAPQQLAELQTP